MGKKYSHQEILSILQDIDAGYQPTAAEAQVLQIIRGLDLSGTSIITLPKSIGLLADLQTLDLAKTKITALPESIGQLANLQMLDLTKAEITTLPNSIGKLVNLQTLNLRSTPILTLPESIGLLVNLQTLDLRRSRINALPKSIGQLSNLRLLGLTGTPITALPESIGQLSNLQALWLTGTRITALPESIGQLSELQTLYIQGTEIAVLPESIGKLTNLHTLDIERTRVSALPDSLGKLPSLQHLDLKGLTIPVIPKALAQCGLPFIEVDYFRFDMRGINLFDVTLTEQNKSIFLETPSLIPELYQQDELVPVRACKVIFLGDGGVGKSYTIQRFCAGGQRESDENTYPTEETHGVEIGNYHVNRENESFDIHFWDFGGQEILHSMHRCFLTEETCYVVMVRTRETESTSRARYWLRVVESAAPKSPVMLFVNCWGNARGDRAIDEPRLRKEFPQIQKTVYCSAKQAEDEDFNRDFMVPLVNIAAASDMCRKTINQKWDKLIHSIQDLQKNALEKREQNYLDKEKYLHLCMQAGINNETTGDLLTLFNNLGVCFSYHKDDESHQELADYKLLNPVWLTNALYAIVEEGSVPAQEGIITVTAIRSMLHNTAQEWFPNKNYRRTVPELIYEDDECQYILDVAQAHRLCYRADANSIFFPALCGTDSPPEALAGAKGGQHVSYMLRYPFLPDNVLHQLMIRCMQSGMVVKPRWLKGMILNVWNLHTAHVRIAEEGNLLIDIFSTGVQPAYELFWTLRKQIEQINKRLNLHAEEYILDENAEFYLEDVVQAAHDNAKLYGHGLKRDARKLLGKYYEESMVQTMQVQNGSIIIPIAPRNFHRQAKSNAILRCALYESYNRICPYCGQTIQRLREMEVDHILPTEFREKPELQSYLKYLDSCGFDIEKPDYIENYFPTHGYCNRDKSNRINEYSLPYWHDIAAQHTPRVMQLMEQYKGKGQSTDDE